MIREELRQRISVDPNVCFGKPFIRGTRIWVSLILDFLASGMSQAEVIEEYPHLTRDDILAALAYGAEMSRERYAVIPFRASELKFKLDGEMWIVETGRIRVHQSMSPDEP